MPLAAILLPTGLVNTTPSTGVIPFLAPTFGVYETLMLVGCHYRTDLLGSPLYHTDMLTGTHYETDLLG